jgi:PRTRC genetic system protein C
MEIQKGSREFRYNSVVIPDPDPNLTIEQVRDTLATLYPEIVNADIEGPEASGAKMVYTFRRAVGTKGAMPREIVHETGGAVAARLALALEQIIDVSERDGRAPTDEQILVRGLKRWWATKTAGMRVLITDLRIHQLANVEDDELVISAWPRNPVDRARELRGPCTVLEKLHPGLAETALHHLYAGISASGMECLTPRFALYGCAARVYWYGEMDERYALEELVEQGEDPADVDLYRREYFFRQVPEWAVDAKPRIGLDALKKLARREEAAEACLELAERVRRMRRRGSLWKTLRQPEDHEDCGVCTAVVWTRQDDCLRLYDDFMNHAFNDGMSEETIFAGVVHAPIERGLRASIEAMDRALDLARETERLLLLISRPMAV